MKRFSELGDNQLRDVRFLVSDIDDTLTLDGVWPAPVYVALEALRAKGVAVILITGRPAGWCDMIARFFPVDIVVGENGSFYFRPTSGQIKRVWVDDAAVRQANLVKLQKMAEQIITEFPGSALAQDNPWRATDVAVDFAEDVAKLPLSIAEQIREKFEAQGATAKVSSIHVNAWIGNYDKLSMFERVLTDEYGLQVDQVQAQTIYTGDSPNDAPMFGRFEMSIGVHSVTRYAMKPGELPKYVTVGDGADGFMEVANRILQNNESQK
ncbi:MAG: HAD-IIB family hydrolase [Robiginitomaculum sp.]|nr:HAD-IIB family hydrolase [Robiginitomaculum sp.]